MNSAADMDPFEIYLDTFTDTKDDIRLTGRDQMILM